MLTTAPTVELPALWNDQDRRHFEWAYECRLAWGGKRMTPERAWQLATAQVERARAPAAWQPGELF